MRLIHGIKKNPSKASKMKMDHFSQIGVTEVFLESTPTAFVMTVIWISAGYGFTDIGLVSDE